MKDMKITFSDDTRNFSGWMSEKSSNVLRDLCCTLQEVPSIKENDSFRCAIDDALKMYALCHGNLNGIRCDLVYALLMHHNINGYYFLCDLVNGTENGRIMQDILQDKRDEDILELIEQNNGLRIDINFIAEALYGERLTIGWVNEDNIWSFEISSSPEKILCRAKVEFK